MAMRMSRLAGALSIVLAVAAPAGAGGDAGEELARLKKEVEAAWDDLAAGRAPGVAEAEQEAASERYCRRVAELARRALALAEAHPDAPEAAEALAWIHDGGLGSYSAKLDAECDAAYDRLAERHLDSDAILPVVRIAWADAGNSAHAGAFLRAAAERSENPRVKALALLSLGRHAQTISRLSQSLDDPIRGEKVAGHLGPENVGRVRAVGRDAARREAEACFERVIREFADSRPLGDDFPTLGEQAEGALFRLRNLEVGCTVPEAEGEDVDGRPMRLSEFRGKVVLISFWATWCGPCMAMVPEEKALVEKMEGRPFALVGVNGDEDRAKAKSVSAEQGITWRSFWSGGPTGPIPSRWGVNSWPTIYVVDAEGVIRHEAIYGDDLDRAVEALVAEAEARAAEPTP